MKIRQLVRDYPMTLSVSVNGILLNFAAAFTQPAFAVLALLFTGAVLVGGRQWGPTAYAVPARPATWRARA